MPREAAEDTWSSVVPRSDQAAAGSEPSTADPSRHPDPASSDPDVEYDADAERAADAAYDAGYDFDQDTEYDLYIARKPDTGHQPDTAGRETDDAGAWVAPDDPAVDLSEPVDGRRYPPYRGRADSERDDASPSAAWNGAATGWAGASASATSWPGAATYLTGTGAGTGGNPAGGNPAGTEGGAAPNPGRHSRQAGSQPGPPPGVPRLGNMPKHAVRPGGPVSATDVTEVLARVREDPTERPRLDRPESGRSRRPAPPAEHDKPAEPSGARSSIQPPTEPMPTGKRVRVVLSQRKGQARPVRTVVDVQELTQVGEVLATSLIRSQLGLALRIGGLALLGLGVLPAAFYLFPDLGRFELFGLRLPWLLLGLVAYPFMVLLGWMYARAAEKLEQIFADHIQS